MRDLLKLPKVTHVTCTHALCQSNPAAYELRRPLHVIR